MFFIFAFSLLESSKATTSDVIKMATMTASCVRLVYPSYPYKSIEHLTKTLSSVRDCGVDVSFRESSVDLTVKPPYSHTHEMRAREVIEAIEDQTPYIWAAAGGSGALQVVSEIERMGYRPTKEFGKLIGFSDATHLHALWATWRGISYHAPDAGLVKETDIHGIGINTGTTLKEMTDIIKGSTPNVRYDFRLLSEPSSSTDLISGSFIGGNAQLLVEIQGSGTRIDPRGKFVFLEDVASDSETDYLQRRLTALRRQGLFTDARAIFFGNLLVGKDGFDSTKDIGAIREFIQSDLLPNGINIPVLYSNEFGHGDKNRVLPFGTKATLALTKPVTVDVSTTEPF